ncbi:MULTISPECIES: cbb3-type cytochrome c oxidase subunit II [Parachlamydia]|jgi:cytochrome c oxidase cbb3-type subunit 2|uniref:Uncharacterized protein n=1 Tax=Parachlamydia acanthamoebae (strain UV7) TaxID=765952 RepID=F8KV93_PARAV|nr:cbb3-type cytochrome c oxidase subunit II [Parachlamydia acanthamoebae]EFB40627.1 hypothetical protein pah_c198o050 [Parachlamydia acanthamoebae str. Hall's coccus]CCB87615.1 putative uncharacterized protein [Parachlamydia acanthamoebae UV-7]
MSQNNFFYNIEKSFVVTIIGVLLLFAGSVAVTLLAPRYVDPTWTHPTSDYQVQMYEVMDPHVYISSAPLKTNEVQTVFHLKSDHMLLAFKEDPTVRIIAPKELQKYITTVDDHTLKLTSRLLLLRIPVAQSGKEYNPVEIAQTKQIELQKAWENANPDWEKEDLPKPRYTLLELYDPGTSEAFALAPLQGILQDWVDRDFKILDESIKQPYHQSEGVIYVHNPIEYRISYYTFGEEKGWQYDPKGESIKNIQELRGHALGFRSRQEFIHEGEQIYAAEGCWYCHTDQTRTLVQDVVLNGSDSFPAPPSSANEYIYQYITFPGTRRIGPDLSRVGIKKPSRDWHMSHFWSPKTASKGSIMPSFQHFFDFDPRGTSKAGMGVPNHRFEAIFQYLMTKGTRITPPTQAWWTGKDPIQTIEIIEGLRRLP